jgi:hypothetical protein
MRDSGVEDAYERSFTRWLTRLDSEFPLPEPGGAAIEWIRRIYQENGEMPAFDFAVMAFERKSQVAWDAFVHVAESARKATGCDNSIGLEFIYPSSEYPIGNIAVGNSTIQSFDDQGVHAEVAEAIQEHLIDRYRVLWPLCSGHGVGMHAVTRDGEAVWWCNVGDHPGAGIPPASTC